MDTITNEVNVYMKLIFVHEGFVQYEGYVLRKLIFICQFEMCFSIKKDGQIDLIHIVVNQWICKNSNFTYRCNLIRNGAHTKVYALIYGIYTVNIHTTYICIWQCRAVKHFISQIYEGQCISTPTTS